MRIACSTSAFTREPLAGALRGVSGLGFKDVDLLVITGWAHVSTTDLADDWDGTIRPIDALLAETGLAPVAFNCGFSGVLHDRSDEARAQRLREAEALARMGRHYDVKVAGVQPCLKQTEKTPEQVFADTIANLREVSERAGPAGLTIALECHVRSVFETIENAVRVVEQEPWLPQSYDPSHFIMRGVDLRDTLPLLKAAAHVHLRDCAPGKLQTHMGEGTLDLDWVVGGLKDAGYTGVLSIEYLQPQEGDACDDIRRMRDRLEALIG